VTGSSAGFTGTAAVNSGAFAVSGGASYTNSAITVNSGGTVLGPGTLGAVTVNTGGSIAPSGAASSSSANLTVSSLVINGGNYLWNLQTSTNGVADSYDTIATLGSVDISSAFTITVNTNSTTLWDQTASTNFTILTASAFTGNTNSITLLNIDSENAGSMGKWTWTNTGTAIQLIYTANSTTVYVTSPDGVTTLQSAVTNAITSETAPLVMTGPGEYVLDLTNSYAANTTIASGTLTAANNSSFGATPSITLGTSANGSSNATLNINTDGITNSVANITVSGTGTNTIANTSGGSVAYSGAVALNTNVTVANIDPNGGVAIGMTLLSGQISGAGTVTVTAGSGTVVLGAASVYTGGTVLQSGTLALSNSTSLGSGALAVSSNATEQALASINVANAVTVASSSTLTLDANGNSFTNSGNISGQGDLLVRDSTGAGTLTLSGSNSYAGTSTVNRGTLALGSTTALPTATTLVVSGTGVVNMAGYNDSVAALSDGGVSTGVITNTTGAATLTVNGSSSSSFSGTIGGDMGLTKSGSGVLNVSGVNNYTGATVINGGTLQLGNASALGTGALTVNSGGLLDFYGNALSRAAIAGSGIVSNSTGTSVLTFTNSGSTTFAGSLRDGTGSLGLVMGGSGTLTMTGSNTAVGGVTVNNGTMLLNSGATLNNVTVTNAGFVNGFTFTNAASTNVVVVSSTAGLAVGQYFAGYYVNNGTTITNIDGNNVYLSANVGNVNTTAVAGAAYNSAGVLGASNATLSNVTVSGFGNGTTRNDQANASVGTVGFSATNTTINGVLNIQGPITGVAFSQANATPGSASINPYGNVFLSTGVVATNIVANGLLTVGGSGSMSLSGITGTSNGNPYYGGLGGSGVITINNTYSSTNSSGGFGNVLNFTGGSVFYALNQANNTAATFTQTGNGSVSFGSFSGNGTSQNVRYYFSGGNWFFNQVGQGNSGQQVSSTNILINGANLTVGTAQANQNAGIWLVTNGALTFQTNVANSGSMNTPGQTLGFVVGSSGTLTMNGTLNLGSKITNTTTYLTNNGGIVNITGNVSMGNAALNTNSVNNLTLNAGTTTLRGNLTVGNAGALAVANVTNTVTLAGGSLGIAGTLGANTSTLETDTFNWTGGTLSVGTVTTTNASWVGGSLNGSTLFNTNSGVFAPGTVGVAGKTTITGNYLQSGNGALALDLLGSNIAVQYQQLVNSNTFYDTISITGTANLGGDLLVNLGGSTPATNAGYTVVQATGGVTNNLNGAHIVSFGTSNGVVALDGFGILSARTNATSLILTNYVFNQYSGTGNWGTGGTSSWTAGVDPNAAVMGAYFGTNGNGSVTMDANRTVSAVVMSNAAGSTLVSSGGSILSFTNNPGGSTNATLTLARGNGIVTAGLNLLANLSVADTASASSTLTLSGNITGGNGLRIATNNVGTVLLAGTNSYTGSTLVNGGTLWLAGTNALSYASSMTASNMSVASNAALVFAVGSANAFTTNQISSALSNGVFLTGSTLGYDVSGTNFSVGSFAGRGLSSLGVYGSGTANLSADNSALSGLVIAASRVNVTGSSSALGGNNAVDTITGNRDITLNLGGTTQSLGGLKNSSTSGILTLQNGTLVFTNAAINQFVNNVVFGSLNQGADSSIQGAMLSQPGTYTVAYLNTAQSANNTLVSTGGSSVLSGSNSGIYFILNGGSLDLNNNYALAGDGPLGYFYAQTNSTITSSVGFTNASSTVVDLSGASIMSFGGNVDMGAATLTLNGASQTLNVTNGTLTLTNGIVSAGSLTKTGSGTLILGGVNNSTTTALNGGTILALGSNSLGANLALSSGLLDLNGNTDTFTTVGFYGNDFTVTNGSFVVTSGYTASNATVAQNLGGAASFTATGGTVNLTGNNTYTGGTFVTNGATLRSVYNSGAIWVTNAGSSTPSTFVAIGYGDNSWTSAQIAASVLPGLDVGAVIAVDATGTNFGITNSLTNGSSFTLGTYSQDGTGTVTLADPLNAYSGVSKVALTGGTLDLGGNALIVTNVTFSSGTLQGGIITNSGTYAMASNATSATITANLSGTAGLSVGNGTLTLASSNSYLGTTTLSGGTLNVAASGAIGTNTLLVSGNRSILNFGTANTTNTFGFTSPNGTNYTIFVTNGAVVNSTAGTYFSGAANGTNSLIIGSGGVFNSLQDKVNLGSYPASNALSLISNNNGTLSLMPSGMQISRNNGSGGTNIYVQTGSDALYTNAGGIVFMAGNANQTNSNINNQFLISGGRVFATTINFGNGNAGYSSTNIYNLISNGAAQVSFTGINFGNNQSNTVGMTNVVVMGDGNLGNGTMTLGYFANGFKTNSGYTNQIIWNGGTLRAGGSSTTFLTNGVASVTVSNVGGFFDANGFTNTIGANITGSGTLTITNSSANAARVTLSGTNTAGLSISEGSGVINMFFSGVQTLFTSNNYSGGTTLAGGLLSIGNANALGTGAITVTGGTLSALTSMNLTNSVTVNSGSLTLSNANGIAFTQSGAISGAGGLTIGAGTTTLSASNSYTGTTTINNNATVIYNATGAATTNGPTLNGNATMLFAGGSNALAGWIQNGASSSAQSIIVTNGATLNWTSGRFAYGTGTVDSTNLLINAGGNLTFTANNASWLMGANGSAYNVISNSAGTSIFTGQTVTLGNAYNNTKVLTNEFNAIINNGGQMIFSAIVLGGTSTANSNAYGNLNQVVLGAGTTTVTQISSGYGSYTNNTNQVIFNGGVLQAGASGTILAANLNSNGVVQINAAGGTIDAAGYNATNAANMSGDGALTVSSSTGTGTLTLSGANSYAGGTTINGGTLAFTSQAALSTGGVTNNATLAYTGSGAQNLSNIVVSGTGAFASAGTGTVTLTGNNSFGGAFTIRSGVLGFATSSALGTTGAIANNGTLLYSGTDAQTMANNISGTGTLSVNSGTLTATGSLNGSITVTNATLIQGSTGAFINTNATASVLTVNNGGNVTLSGSNAMVVPASITIPAIQVNSGGSVSFASANALTPSLSVYNPGGTNYGTGASRVIVLGVTGGTAYFTNNGVTNTLNGGTNIASLSGGTATNINVNENILLTGTGNGATNLIISNGATLVQNAPAGNSGTSLLLQSNAVMLIGSNGTYVNNNLGNNLSISAGTLQIDAGGLITNTAAAGGINVGSANSRSYITNAGTIAFAGNLLFSAGTNQFDSTGVLNLGASSFRGNGGFNTINLLSNSVTYTGFNLNGGTNVVRIFGGATSYGLPNIGYSSTGASNLVVVDSGAMVTNTNSGSLFVGQNSSSSINTLTNNGTIYSTNVWLAGQAGSSNVNTIYQAGGSLTINTLGFQYGNGGAGSNNTSLVNVTGGTMTVSGSTRIGDNGTNNSNTLQVDGGSANLTTVIMGSTAGTSRSNTNKVVLNGGTLSATQFQAGSLSAAAGDSNSIVFDGGTLRAASGASTNFIASNVATVTLNSGGGTIDSSSNAITIGASIGGVGGLTKAGAGTLTLSGDNSYTGGTFVSGGSLLAGSASALGSSAISLSEGGAFNYSGGSATLANDITVTSGTGIIRNSGGGVLNLIGTLTKQGSILAFYGGSYNVTGTITGTSPGGSFNSDLVLSNAAVTLGSAANYYGPTALLAGSTLTAGVGNALPTSTILTVGGAGEGSSVTNSYNLNGYSQTLGGLTGAGNGVNRIYNNSGTQSLLTLAGSSTFGGSINGNIALTVSGGSSVNLSGISDYIGATTIKDSSSLNLGATGSLNHTSNVIVSAGSTFLLGASSKVNASAGLRLEGGTISMGGNGSSRAGYQAFSTLTLTGNSVIDFANLSGNSALSFGSITMNGNSLSIYNWSGNPIYGDASPTRPGTFTQLLSSTGLSQSDLNNISFYSGSGTGFLGNGFWSGGEIVPVPEPAVVIVACMLLGWLVIANRATLLALLRRRNA
jgi:fibronectin-binding autotransporter adhesin